MKNFILGFLICAFLFTPAVAKAVEISFGNLMLKDIFAACALAGSVSRGNSWTSDQHAEFAWRCADAMVAKRK